MGKLHCFCILLLPTLASRHGRRFVLVILMASLLDSPITNMHSNAGRVLFVVTFRALNDSLSRDLFQLLTLFPLGLVTAQMNCIAEKARNTSDVMVDSIRGRYTRLHNHVIAMKNRTEERMRNITEKVTEVGVKVKKKYTFLVRVLTGNLKLCSFAKLSITTT